MCVYKPAASGWWFTGVPWAERGCPAPSLPVLREMTNSQFMLGTTNPPPPPNPSVPLSGVLVMALWAQRSWTSKHTSNSIYLSQINWGEAAFLLFSWLEWKIWIAFHPSLRLSFLCGQCQYDIGRLWNYFYVFIVKVLISSFLSEPKRLFQKSELK